MSNETVFNIDSALNGEYIIPYEWSETSRRAIVSDIELKRYVPTNAFKDAFRVCRKVFAEAQNADSIEGSGSATNILISGATGTGKTVMVRALCASLGLPLVNLALNTSLDGISQHIFSQGGVILVEDISMWEPEAIQTCLDPIMGSPYSLTDGGEAVIKRHPMCVIIATMSQGYIGTHDVSKQTLSLFSNKYMLHDFTDDEMREILKTTKHASASDIDFVVGTYRMIKDYAMYRRELDAHVITIRACQALLRTLDIIGKEKAILPTMINHFKSEEFREELKEFVAQNVFGRYSQA